MRNPLKRKSIVTVNGGMIPTLRPVTLGECEDPRCLCHSLFTTPRNTDYYNTLKRRIDEAYAEASALSDTEKETASMSTADDLGENATGAAAPDTYGWADEVKLRNKIASLKAQAEFIERCLDTMDIPEDVVSAFDCMVEDDDHSLIGTPREYERTDDHLLSIARVIFKGDPYAVIASTTYPDDGNHTHYVYLKDDFSFTLANAIVTANT